MKRVFRTPHRLIDRCEPPVATGGPASAFEVACGEVGQAFGRASGRCRGRTWPISVFHRSRYHRAHYATSRVHPLPCRLRDLTPACEQIAASATQRHRRSGKGGRSRQCWATSRARRSRHAPERALALCRRPGVTGACPAHGRLRGAAAWLPKSVSTACCGLACCAGLRLWQTHERCGNRHAAQAASVAVRHAGLG